MPKRGHLVAGLLPTTVEERALDLLSTPTWLILSSVTSNKSLKFAKPQPPHLIKWRSSQESKSYIT